MLGQEMPKTAKGNEIRITKVATKRSSDERRKSAEDKKENPSPNTSDINVASKEQTR